MSIINAIVYLESNTSVYTVIRLLRGGGRMQRPLSRPLGSAAMRSSQDIQLQILVYVDYNQIFFTINIKLVNANMLQLFSDTAIVNSCY